jgi:rhodanese-related sulfurtransferase
MKRLTAIGLVGLVFLGCAGMVAEPKGETITADELRDWQRAKVETILFDARTKTEFEAERIPGAKLPLSLKYYNDLTLFRAGILPKQPDLDAELAKEMKPYPKDARIVTFCNRNCKASLQLRHMLKKLGFERVYALEDGVDAWKDAGYPTEGEKAKKEL